METLPLSPVTTTTSSALYLPQVHPLISGKWRLSLIYSLRGGTLRYGEIRRMHPQISEKVLVYELKDLTELGAVERIAYRSMPPRVDYKLTPKGQLVLQLIGHLQQTEQAMQVG
ncbi:winged helix-turn-helix transcriptional regulator [Spirosoma montaniterrae]|uniref:winged helix-turn-helix transcriptional regulator n=1 Tax=Spirosoma montaniterrae TaxID=1178516 RepID=UPI0009F88510|nr:helix-turn-helix domain-containing protein [Spirosoma montaniterrae]